MYYESSTSEALTRSGRKAVEMTYVYEAADLMNNLPLATLVLIMRRRKRPNDDEAAVAATD